MAGDKVEVTIGASPAELKRDLDQAGNLVKNFKEQAGRAREAATFFAGAIQNIGGASSQAASLAGNMLGAFAMGGPMGIAIGGVNALIAHLKESGEAAKKAAEESKKWLEGTQKNIDSLRDRLARLNAEMAGGKLGLAQYEADKERGKAADELAKASERRLAAERELAQIDTDNIQRLEAGVGEINTDNVKQRIADAQKQEDAARTQFLETIKTTEAELFGARKEHAKQAQEAADKTYSALQKEIKATDDLTAAEKALLEQQKRRTDLASQGIGAAALPEAQVSEGSAARYGAPTVEFDAWGKAGANADGFSDQNLIEDAKKGIDDTAASADRLYDSMYQFGQLANPIGQAFGSMFASMGGGAKSLTSIWKSATKQIMQSLYQMAVKSIMSHAAGAAAGAAESQAGIPVIGPGLAIAAMGAMLATVTGLMDNLPSAAGGWVVPQDITANVHKGEHIIPARIAKAYEEGAPGSGNGGNTFIIQATDPKSFEDYLERNSDVVIRRLNTWERDRRY
jgi:hypothetical protein